jgi:type IV pilus assembly protein PilB
MDIPKETLLGEGFTQEDLDSGLKIYRAVGCGSCTDGYKGRTGLYQVMPITEEIQRIILQGGNAVDIAAAAEREGIWDLRRSGISKVKAGITSLEEINQTTVE